MSAKIKFPLFRHKKIIEKHLNLGGASFDGQTIEVTSSFLRKNDLPWIPVVGEFHFSRMCPEKWKRELAKIKSGGITCIATYLFWIYHEEDENVFNFSGRYDIREFVLLCRKFGLDVIVRIGPWYHGECRNGGFPDWLLKKKIPLRTNDPKYLLLVRRLYSQYSKQLNGLFFKDGGPIVAVQVENELVNNAPHLAELVSIAKECGIVVPIFTATGWNNAHGAEIPLNDVVPVFGGYCDAPWDSSLAKKTAPSMHYFFLNERNDSAVGSDLSTVKAVNGQWHLPYERYPFLTCEIGGGLQSTYHRRYVVRPMDVYAMALVKLGCGNNMPGYYVYHGGTNPIGKNTTLQESKATGYPNDYPVLNYDYNAPVSEYGEVRPHLGMLNLMHLFLHDFQNFFAPLQPHFLAPVSVNDTVSVRCAMRTDGYRGFLFINHYQRLYPLDDIYDVVIDTGLNLIFPSLNLVGEIAFFLPFRFPMVSVELLYSTSQLLCKEGNTYFFMEISGVPAEYSFSDGRKIKVMAGIDSGFEEKENHIVTLTQKQALGLRRLRCGLVFSTECNLYEMDGELHSAEDGEFEAFLWSGHAFRQLHVSENSQKTKATLSLLKCSQPFEIPEMLIAELQLNGKNTLSWYKLKVSSSYGFVEIPKTFDVAQIYVDGKLVADRFYDGMTWRIPAEMLFGHEAYLVTTPIASECCYHEW